MLTINKMFYPEIGGVETIAYQIAKIVPNSKVLTFQKEKNKNTYTENINDIQITRLKTSIIKDSIRWSWEYSKKFKQLNDNINIFHFPSGQPELYYNIIDKNKHNICFYHADIVNKGIIGKIYNKIIVSKFLDKMEYIITTSDEMKNSSEILQPFKDKIKVINPFVDTDHFGYFNQKKDNPTVLYVGRLSEYKGLPYLIEQIAKCPYNYKLIIVGEGSMKYQLIKLQHKLNIQNRVQFINHVSYDNLPKIYNMQSVFVLPSISRAEAFGLVGIEQLSSGVPVITTELGTGTTSYVKQNITGLTVPSKDSNHLQQQIINIISNMEQYNPYSLRNFAESFYSIKKFNFEISSFLQTMR